MDGRTIAYGMLSIYAIAMVLLHTKNEALRIYLRGICCSILCQKC